MNPKRTSTRRRWPHYPLHKAVAKTFEASDLIAASVHELATQNSRRGHAYRIVASRTSHALQQTQAMLDQAANAINRAKTAFAPLGLTRSPF